MHNSRESPKGTPLRWIQAEETLTPIDNPFQGAEWHTVKADAGRYLRLNLLSGDTVVGHLGVRDVSVLGTYNRWALLGEPVALQDDPINQREALQSLISFAHGQGIDVIECQFNMARWLTDAVEHTVPSECHEAFGTYVVDLRDGMDAVKSGFSSNHKRQMKQAIKASAQVRDQVEREPLLELLSQVYGRTGRKSPFSAEYLDRLLATQDLSLVTVTVEGPDGIEMAIIVPYDSRRGYFLHGAAKPGGLRGAAVLGHFEVMRLLSERGVPEYDLGGARPWHQDKRLQGIAEFKRRFGGPFEAVSRFTIPLTRKGRLIHKTIPGIGQLFRR